MKNSTRVAKKELSCLFLMREEGGLNRNLVARGHSPKYKMDSFFS